MVEHVIVNERGRVDHLHDRRQHQVFAADRADGLGGQQHQGRPQPLAPQSKTVADELIHAGIVAPQFGAKNLLGLGHFLGDRIVEVGEKTFWLPETSANWLMPVLESLPCVARPVSTVAFRRS